MNKQTRKYKNLGLAVKTVKGTNSINVISCEKFEGKYCYTDFKDRHKNPMNKRNSPWRGAKRNEYN